MSATDARTDLAQAITRLEEELAVQSARPLPREGRPLGPAERSLLDLRIILIGVRGQLRDLDRWIGEHR